MFLRSNLRRGGIVFSGQPYQATYVAAMADGDIVGVIARNWNGIIAAQAPLGAPELARALPSFDGRPTAGFVGPAPQIAVIKPILAPREIAPQADFTEVLFALDINRLIAPALLAFGGGAVRPATQADLDLLVSWRHDYLVEAFGAASGPQLSARARQELEGRLDHTWLLVVDGAVVAYQSFNATLPDMVQVGGVWTPPTYRRRGYGRAVVAGALLHAHRGGARRAILFTNEGNVAAQRAYTALGFARIGDYALVLYPAAMAPVPVQS